MVLKLFTTFIVVAAILASPKHRELGLTQCTIFLNMFYLIIGNVWNKHIQVLSHQCGIKRDSKFLKRKSFNPLSKSKDRLYLVLSNFILSA